MRTTLPSLVGLRPRSEAMIARSMSAVSFFSHGWMTISRLSGTVSDATWLSGVGVP